jgi:4-alpha-glucanotransferase
MGSFKLGDPQNERINAPYDTYNRWKYRMPMTLESLMDERQFNEKLKTMIVRSKR